MAYYIIAMSQFMRRIAYKGSFIVGICSRFLKIFLYCFLWSAIYESSRDAYINEFTEREMIMYVIISATISDIIMSEVAKKIADDVREGALALKLVKPINYKANLLSMCLGDYLHKVLFWGVPVFTGIDIYMNGKLQLGARVIVLLLFLFSIICSYFLYALFDFMFGMLSIKTTYSFGMLIIKDAVFAFVSGQMIPYSFMPSILADILHFLPFSSMVYTPVMIFLGKYTIYEINIYILNQLFWILILHSIGNVMWKKYIQQITILGG